MHLTGFRLILLICLFVGSCFSIVASHTAPPERTVLAAASTIAPAEPLLENPVQEAPRQIETVAVDAVRETSADVPLDGNASSAKEAPSLIEGLDGNDVVAVAVNEQDRGTGADVASQVLSPGKEPRKANNTGKRPRAAKANVKRHHRALAKANKRQRIVRKTKARKLLVQKRVKGRRRVAHAAPAFLDVTER